MGFQPVGENGGVFLRAWNILAGEAVYVPGGHPAGDPGLTGRFLPHRLREMGAYGPFVKVAQGPLGERFEDRPLECPAAEKDYPGLGNLPIP